MRTSPRSEQSLPPFQKISPDLVIEVSSLDVLMMIDDLGLNPEFEDWTFACKKPS